MNQNQKRKGPPQPKLFEEPPEKIRDDFPKHTERIAAEHRRDRGMARAEAHADAVIEEWNQLGDAALRKWLSFTRSSFLAEAFVNWTRSQGIAQPPDPRAWGAVLRRAALIGWIERVGYAPANSSNRSPKCLWEGRI